MTISLGDMKDLNEVIREYEKQFGKTKTARSYVAIKKLPKDVGVEMECVALP